MNNIYILYSICFIVVVVLSVILIYNFIKDKNDKIIHKLRKFNYNRIKNLINSGFPFNLEPVNLDMLNENIDSIAVCMTNLLMKVLKESNIDVKKYIDDILTTEEREKMQENMKKYIKDSSKCFSDNQIESIVYITNKLGSGKVNKIEMENIIRYVKTNIKFNKCYLDEKTCGITDTEKEILNEYRPTSEITTRGPIKSEIIFDISDKYFMATPLGINPTKPVNVSDYPGLVLKNYDNNGGAGSLFYIGKIDNYGSLKKVSIKGEFSNGSPDSYFSIIILPPTGEQHDLLTNSLLKILVGKEKDQVKYWYQFDFSRTHNFLSNFENLSIQLKKNSDVFLYLFGAKTSTTSLTTPNLDISNSEITFEGDFY